jgi:glycosyltransferase involved in cell wall biosynthesis
MKPTCVVSCPINTFSGYGARSRDFVRSLIKAKGDEWNIQILPQRWGNTPEEYLKEGTDSDLLSRINPNLTQQPEIWIQITVPNEFQPIGKFNIGVTAGIESTMPPGEWIEGCNRMNLNLVSSEFTKQTFQNVAYTKNDSKTNQPIGEIRLNKPMEVLMEGLDLDVYFKKPEKSGLLDNIDESFAFLFTGHWLPGDFGHDRKNVSQLIWTFLQTFKGKGTKPALLLKCNAVDYSLMDKQYIEDKINMIKEHFKGEDLPNIYLLHGEFTNEELNQINNDPKVKAFVSFTRGEGFGRPLLEQAITGKPVITTNWSGHTDFIRPEYNVLIGGNLENIHPSAANNMLLKEGQWFKIDVDVASKAMKDVYKNYKKYVEQSRKQTQFLKTNFSKENMTDVLKTHLDKIQVAANVPLQLPKLQLPKLKKVGEKEPTQELPKLKLPKLKKVEA